MAEGGPITLPAALEKSREHTEHVVQRIAGALTRGLGPQQGTIFGDHTTFFLTGSGGRGEMTSGSDVDGYIVRVLGDVDTDHDAAFLSAMTDALLETGLPELDRGGEFLAMKTASDLVDEMGSADDDHGNAFTIRMLFLLESQPLIGESAYDELFRLVSGAYRSTAKQHAEDFLPFYFVNDVVRYWRTVLLNHEDRLRSKAEELAGEGALQADLDEELLAHRRYRSQKLRFPRCLSCFSSLAYLLAIAPQDQDAISGADEREMFARSPAERLVAVAERQSGSRGRVERLLELYAGYMERTSDTKEAVMARLRGDEAFRAETSRSGQEFTREMFFLIQELGQGNRLHRQMLI